MQMVTGLKKIAWASGFIFPFETQHMQKMAGDFP
jgi:hypothetical protein